jgi:hypothetical protein
MPRWNRLSHISSEEKQCLERITDNTKGMTIYGNKSRLAVMLETDLAYMVSMVSQFQNLSVGELCGRLLREQFSTVSGLISFGDYGQTTVNQDQLLLNLSLQYGGFIDYEKAQRMSFKNIKKTQINVGENNVALIQDNMQKMLSLYDHNQIFWYREHLGSFLIGCDLREINDGYIILNQPINQHLHDFLTQATIS